MEGAYNSEMYKRKKCKGKDQEDYCTPVYDAWCNDKHDHKEHQKTAASIPLGGASQSSAKPKQMA